MLISFAPLVGMVLVENKINRHYNFGHLQSLLSHSLTLLVGSYHYLQYFCPPPPRGKRESQEQLAKEEEQLYKL